MKILSFCYNINYFVNLCYYKNVVQHIPNILKDYLGYIIWVLLNVLLCTLKYFNISNSLIIDLVVNVQLLVDILKYNFLLNYCVVQILLG